MKKVKIIGLIFFFSILCSQPTFSQADSQYVANQLIVKFKDSKKPIYKNIEKHQKFENSALDLLNITNNIQSMKLTGHKIQGNTFVLTFNSDKAVEDLIKSYMSTGLFEFVESNYGRQNNSKQTIPNDSEFGQQWAHVNDGTFSDMVSTNDADMDTDLAWDITKGDPNLIVAILDTGAKLDHPEFAGRIWINDKENKDGSDSDLNEYIDDINGWDFVNNDNDPTDDNGQGTIVTGIALASGDNNIGYAGMNWNSKIMICKVTSNDNISYFEDLAEAIYYAVDNGAAVININMAFNDSSQLLKFAIDYAYSKNVPIVAPVGNLNTEIKFPANYSKVIAVGSTNPDDTRTKPFAWDDKDISGSNFGPEIDFVAPGNHIYGLDHESNTNYVKYSGTLQAASHVTGLISLLLSINPTLTIPEIRTILEDSSDDQVGGPEDTEGWDQYYGHGRINAFKALSSPVLGVKTLKNSDNNILIYPNPLIAKNSLDILNLINGEYAISIYNTLGQILQDKKISTSNSKLIIPLPELNAGTYLLRIESNQNDISMIKKLIVK